jgi:hypothetical protein
MNMKGWEALADWMKSTLHNLIIYAELNLDSYHPSFDVLLTVHLSLILVINQLNAQNLVL